MVYLLALKMSLLLRAWRMIGKYTQQNIGINEAHTSSMMSRCESV